LTVGGGAVRFPIEAGGALKEIIDAPSLDAVRGLDARTNIGYAVEPGAASVSEPDIHGLRGARSGAVLPGTGWMGCGSGLVRGLADHQLAGDRTGGPVSASSAVPSSATP
jgi:hypothetical protein